MVYLLFAWLGISIICTGLVIYNESYLRKNKITLGFIGLMLFLFVVSPVILVHALIRKTSRKET